MPFPASVGGPNSNRGCGRAAVMVDAVEVWTSGRGSHPGMSVSGVGHGVPHSERHVFAQGMSFGSGNQSDNRCPGWSVGSAGQSSASCSRCMLMGNRFLARGDVAWRRNPAKQLLSRVMHASVARELKETEPVRKLRSETGKRSWCFRQREGNYEPVCGGSTEKRRGALAGTTLLLRGCADRLCSSIGDCPTNTVAAKSQSCSA